MPDRDDRLDPLATLIADALRRDGAVRLVFICTHNARRSHMAQVWAQAAAWEHGLDGVTTYSAGTEATAFHPCAVEALRRAGLEIPEPRASENPVYEVRVLPDRPPLACFSKRFDDPSIPGEPFIAVMVCGHAAEHCPVIPAAAHRLSLPYRDPKEADGTPGESTVYDERSAQIRGDMRQLFERVGALLGG